MEKADDSTSGDIDDIERVEAILTYSQTYILDVFKALFRKLMSGVTSIVML